jgi:hypothetical protein
MCSSCYAHDGNMFEVKAKDEDLAITTLSTRTYALWGAAGTFGVEVWTKPGTMIGFEHDQSAWTKVADHSFTAGAWEMIQFPEFETPVHIAAGQTQSFYVAFKDGAVALFSSIDAPNTMVSEDAKLQLFNGYYNVAGFGGKGQGTWNGAMTYVTAKGAVATTPLPTSPPSMPPTPLPTNQPSPPPSPAPVNPPTPVPTNPPSPNPTPAPVAPTNPPTPDPTSVPTNPPTPVPTNPPTPNPTSVPTNLPTAPPTVPPTPNPTSEPTSPPTPVPSNPPTPNPTALPTNPPTSPPTVPPTPNPTPAPVDVQMVDMYVCDKNEPLPATICAEGRSPGRKCDDTVVGVSDVKCGKGGKVCWWAKCPP